jgi:hypothetical protein
MSVVFVLLIKYYLGDRVKRSEMCGEYGMYGGEKRCMYDFGAET